MLNISVAEMQFITRCILALLLLTAGGRAAQTKLPPGQASQPSSVTQHNDPVAMFLRLFDLLDANGDGVAPMADVFDALDLQRAEARQVKRARALDGNNDGQITRAEAVAGVRAEIAYQTQRRMNTDVNGDGELTPAEYALAVADPDGKADADGLTPLQRSAFKFDDLNGDGKVTRAEVETRLGNSYAESYWALRMAVRARRADGNRDALIDEQEWAQIEGSAPTDALRKRFLAAGAKEGRLTVQNLQLLFLRMTAEERSAAEKQMAAFEERTKTSSGGNTKQ